MATILDFPVDFVEESVTLHFASFETDCSGYEEEKEKMGKFTQFHAISQIENNFPFELSSQPLFHRLVNDFSEIVFAPYAS